MQPRKPGNPRKGWKSAARKRHEEKAMTTATKPKMTAGTAVPLGAGVLTWEGQERRTDRYGTVYLIPEDKNSFSSPGPTPSVIEGAAAGSLLSMRGRLVAKVTATRQSTHAGDRVREIYPRTPKVGDRIVLGEGTFFTDPVPAGGVAVGLRPDNPSGARFRTDRHGFRAMIIESRTIPNDDGTAQVKTSLHDPWLDVRALYDAHEQSVELLFEPA